LGLLTERPSLSKIKITGNNTTDPIIDLTELKEKGPTAFPPVVWATNATPQMAAVNASNNELLICFDLMIRVQLSLNVQNRL
jgi:hypothetical protein